MRDRTFYFVGAPIAVVASAVIAYALVFVLPKFTGHDIIDVYYPGNSYVDRIEYTSSPTYPDIGDLTKLQPEEFQGLIQGIFDSLVELPEAQLYMLNAVDDVCRSTLITCQGVPSKVVKPFVEKALAYKQTSEATAIASGGLATSRWSLAIAIAAFLLSVIGLLLKVRKAVPPAEKVN